MTDFDRVKERGERLRKRMNDAISPEKAWDTIHDRNSPPRRYPNPNFLTNPDVTDPSNFDERKDHDDLDDDDFYEYLTDEEDKKHDDRREDNKQHDIEDEEYRKRIEELEKKKKLDDLRDKINQDAHHNLLKHQIDKTRVIDPFAKQPDPPLVLQLYLRIFGAMYLNPRDIALVDDPDKKLSELNVFRNTFIQYKDFPRGNTQRTQVMWNTNHPIFNHKAYFPIIVRADIFELFSKFYFLFEVWDQVTPDHSDLVGITKFSLNGFFKSLVFEQNGLLNTAYFEDDMNQYPMVGFDDNAPINNFDGKSVGWLKLTCALGSPDQVNRFDSIQADRDKQRAAEEEERVRQQKKKRQKEVDESEGNTKEVEGLLRELIGTIKDQGTGGSSREKGTWNDNQLDSLHKFFED